MKVLPELLRYIINIIKKTDDEDVDYQGTVEFWWDTMQDIDEAFASPEGREANDIAFRYVERATAAYKEEHVIL